MNGERRKKERGQEREGRKREREGPRLVERRRSRATGRYIVELVTLRYTQLCRCVIRLADSCVMRVHVCIRVCECGGCVRRSRDDRGRAALARACAFTKHVYAHALRAAGWFAPYEPRVAKKVKFRDRARKRLLYKRSELNEKYIMEKIERW